MTREALDELRIVSPIGALAGQLLESCNGDIDRAIRELTQEQTRQQLVAAFDEAPK